ncbi:hypothetical protein V8F33_005932 [Rhypophila sp. PSN 637]
MPGVTIQREESENDASKLPSWALIPSPRSPRTHGRVDSRALIPFSAPAQERAADKDTQGSNTDGPFPSFPENPSGTNNTTGLTFYFATQIINITTPTVTHSPCPCEVYHHETSPRTASPRVVVEEPNDSESETNVSRSSRSPSPRKLPPDFFSWDAYTPVILPKKRSPAMRASHEEVIDAFDGVEVSGPVSGLGRLAKPLINKYHTSGFVSEFQASGERVLLLPSAAETTGTPSTPTSTLGELERLECEMFDISKYRGDTNHLTVLTWASDSHWGTITLFELDVEESPDDDDNWATGNRRGRRREQGVRIRPIAAMEDVPKGILVNMRIDQDIRKTVLEYSTSKGRYKWRSQVRPGPLYARILGDRRRRPQPSSLLQVDDIRTSSTGRSENRTKSSSSRSRGRRAGTRAERDADTGIVATVPQFMALLHANRSILEVVSAVDGTETVKTDVDGDDARHGKGGTMMRCIRMTEKPIGKRHAGRDVHVVVLMPNASPWADEKIVWTDQDGELEELRQKVFWDVIGRGRSCSRASSKASTRVFGGSRWPRPRDSRSVDGRGALAGRRTGGRRSRAADERSRSPPKSARW